MYVRPASVAFLSVPKSNVACLSYSHLLQFTCDISNSTLCKDGYLCENISNFVILMEKLLH